MTFSRALFFALIAIVGNLIVSGDAEACDRWDPVTYECVSTAPVIGGPGWGDGGGGWGNDPCGFGGCLGGGGSTGPGMEPVFFVAIEALNPATCSQSELARTVNARQTILATSDFWDASGNLRAGEVQIRSAPYRELFTVIPAEYPFGGWVEIQAGTCRDGTTGA